MSPAAPLLYEGQFPQAYLPLRGFATRDRYGPSILNQAGRCMRSWGLRYLCGFDSQEPEWSDIADHAWDGASRTWRGIIAATGAYQPVPPRKRSTALGTEGHRIAGAFYEGLPSVPGYKTWAEAWASFPGQVAQAWLDVMPRPDECDQVFSELPVALYPDPEGEELPGGLVIEGTSDLLLRLSEANVQKYYAHVGDGWLAGDFKTTRDWRYQKDAATLRVDRQGIVYPLASMRRLDLDALPGRWAYSITDVRKRREARATDFVQTREHAEAAVAGYFREAGVLKGHYRAFTAIKAGGSATSDVALTDRLAYAQALPADTTKCDDFGGCPHSWERGGACMARRDLGSRLQGTAKAQAPSLEAALEASLAAGTCAATPTRVYTTDNQIVPASALARSKSMSPWKQAAERFKAAQAAAKAAPAGPLAAEARASVALDGETVSIGAATEPALELEPVQAAAAEAPKRTRGRPPGAKNKPKAAVPQHERDALAEAKEAEQREIENAKAAGCEPFVHDDAADAGPHPVDAELADAGAKIEADTSKPVEPNDALEDIAETYAEHGFDDTPVRRLRAKLDEYTNIERRLRDSTRTPGLQPIEASEPFRQWVTNHPYPFKPSIRDAFEAGLKVHTGSIPADPAALETASELAGAHAANSLRAGHDLSRPFIPLYEMKFSHFADGDGYLAASVRVPRHRVAAAAEAIDAFVAAVFPSATPGAVPGAKP